MAKKNWQDIGNVKARRAGRAAQWAADAAYRAKNKVVADGDTLSSLAEQSGLTPEEFLAANPELQQLKTGMVVNLPGGMQIGNAWNPGATPGSEEWRVRNTQPYLPSNGPLGVQGGPQGYQGAQVNPWGNATPGYNTLQQQTQNAYNYQQQVPMARYQYQYRPNLPDMNTVARATAKAASIAPIAAAAQFGATQAQQTQQPAQVARPTQRTQNLPMSYPGGFMRWAREELAQSMSAGYTPNEMAVKVLVRAGLLEPTQPLPNYTGGGGYGRGRRRGGGRNRGGGGGPTAPRMPAFSGGSGNMSLVNWRI